MSGGSNRIASLDGLRALSITAVVVGHITSSRLGDFAHLGVCAFFVISGYLITTLLVTERGRTGRISIGKFYLRRTFRILPAALAYLAIISVVVALGYAAFARHDLIHALTYTVNYHDSHARSWYVGHLWSLSVEEQFYLVWPAAIAVFGVAGGLRGALAAIVLCPVIRIAAAFLDPASSYMLDEGFQYAADALATGCALAIGRDWLHRQPRYLALLESGWVFPLVIVMAAADKIPSAKVLWLVGETTRNVGIALLIDRAITVQRGGLFRFLNLAPIVWYGQLSYSLYLWQQPFLNRHGSWYVNQLPLNLACAFAAAVASYYLVEQPALRLRARWFPDRARGRPAAAREPRAPGVAEAAGSD